MSSFSLKSSSKAGIVICLLGTSWLCARSYVGTYITDNLCDNPAILVVLCFSDETRLGLTGGHWPGSRVHS